MSVLVVAQPSSEVPKGLMNYPMLKSRKYSAGLSSNERKSRKNGTGLGTEGLGRSRLPIVENIPYKNHPLNCVDRQEVGNLQVSEKWNLAKRALLEGRLQEQRVAAIRGDTKLAT